MSYTELDILKYLAATSRTQIDWAVDYIGGNACYELSDEDAQRVEDAINEPLEAIAEIPATILSYVKQLEPNFTLRAGKYSDGRRVTSSVQIETGSSFAKDWHYDVAVDMAAVNTITGTMSADPGQYRGTYTVVIKPQTQELEVTLHPATFSYYAEPAEALPNLVANIGWGDFDGQHECIALDIGDSLERRTVYLNAKEAVTLGKALVGNGEHFAQEQASNIAGDA